MHMIGPIKKATAFEEKESFSWLDMFQSGQQIARESGHELHCRFRQRIGHLRDLRRGWRSAEELPFRHLGIPISRRVELW